MATEKNLQTIDLKIGSQSQLNENINTYEEGTLFGTTDLIGVGDLAPDLRNKVENNAKVNSSNTFTESQIFNKDITINGNIIQNGDTYKTHAEELYTKKNIIFTREGAISTLGDNEYTGIQAVKYDGINDGQLIFDKDGIARVGDVGDTQPLATRSEKEELIGGNLLQWDAANNKIIDAGKTTSEFVLKTIDSSKYMIYSQRPSGIETDPGGIQMIEYSSSELESTIAYRDENGVLKTKTAAESSQSDVDCINRGELINKLSNYEKSPNYVLIEKVITGYTVLETEPEDFATNYASYYKTNGKARNDVDFNYVALTEAETFETGKYYSKTTEKTNLYRYGSNGKEPDGTPYAFKNLSVNIENSDTQFDIWSVFHFYVGNRALSVLYYGGLNDKERSKQSQVSADVQGNAVNAYAMTFSSEDYSISLRFSKKAITSDTSTVLSGVRIHDLPADTTVLIYGVRI